MPRGASAKVTLSGPFFTQDVSRVFGDNLVSMLADAAAEMEGEVKDQFSAHASQMPFYTGHSRSTVRGRVASLTGRQWHKHAVVSADTSDMDRGEAIATKAAASGIEQRWHPFRKVASAERRAVKAANLTRGLE